jgi:hypothetical protein
MRYSRMFEAFAASALLLGAGAAFDAAAQDAKAIAGTWTMVSNTVTLPSGEKMQPFGSDPRGVMVFAPDGRYVNTVMKASLPKFAGDSRMKGTAEEHRAVVEGSISHFGKYSVEGKAIVFNIERSTYPNWDGTTQKRTFTLAGDELKYVVPAASVQGTAEVVWKRAK